MLKKLLIALLCGALIIGTVDYRVYGETIYEEEVFSEEEQELLGDGATLESFSIKDISPIRIWSGVIPEYDIITDADLEDIVIKLSTENKGIIEIDHNNNSVHGWKSGTETLTAEAYLKEDENEPSKHIIDTCDVTVYFPEGEIITDYDGNKIISFDGENEYCGWVKPERNNKYTSCGSLVAGGSYFYKEGDAVDCDFFEDASGMKIISEGMIGKMAAGCAVWIKEGDTYRLYKFDEDGVVMYNDLWHRMKDITLSHDDETIDTDISINLTEGEKYIVSVDFVPESVEDDPIDINDSKSVHITSSMPNKADITDIEYKYGTNHNGDRTIESCSFAICALSSMNDSDPDVEITVISGDDDNKYRDDIQKVIKVRTVVSKGFKRIENRLYYVKDDGGFYEGWYPDNVNPEYYFFSEEDENHGYGKRYAMAEGITRIFNGDKTEYRLFSAEGNYIGECEGWQVIDGYNYYFYSKIDMAKGCTPIDGKKYFFDKDGHQVFNGLYTEYGTNLTYAVNKNGVVLTGWQTINKKKFYFNPNTAALVKGFANISGKTYYLPEEGGTAKGYIEIEGSKYYFDSNGVMTTGWVKIKDNGVTDWHFFSKLTGKEITPDSVTTEGKSYWRSITENSATVNYYFPNNGTPYVAIKSDTGKITKSGVIVESTHGEKYYFDAKGTLYKGWIKLTIDNVTDWHFFSYSSGEEITDITTSEDPDGKSKWRSLTDAYGSSYTFFFPQDKSVAKGFKGGFYFDSVTGNLAKGDFKVKNAAYYADENGYILVNGWHDSKYYNSAGKMVKGFNTINKQPYYFDDDGVLAKGVFAVKGKNYLSDTETGVVLKNFYGEAGGEYYYTNGSGVLMTGWQLLKKYDGAWHYFDETTYKEVIAESEVPASDGKSVWRKVAGNTYYFPGDKSVAKGFKDIKDDDGVKHTYYFDKTDGKMLRGKITVGKKTYYLNNDGEKMFAGFIKINGNHYYLNKSGEVAGKWLTVNGNKYYADPVSGIIATGFETIGKNMYYFSETEASAGIMQTGFFHVYDRGQSYYDDNGSNLYYADKNGVIQKGGWKDIKENGKSKDAQAWSYYIDTVTHELAVGNVLIHENGTVEKYESGDMTDMYSFDEKTGARKKTVLYFHGGAYTESLMSVDQRSQLNTMLSLARYINTDKKLTNPTDMMILAGYSDLGDYGITMSGNGFPIAACSYVDAEKSIYEAESGFDVVKYDPVEDKYVSGSDGAVDIGDIEAYSFELYKQVIEKFGPNNVVLMGASSGGAVALSILEKASQNGVNQPSETILYSPWLDATMDNPKAKRYSSRGVDYGTLVARGARVTRDKTYNDGNPYGLTDDAAGPGTHSPAAWFASPALKSNNCKFEGVGNITIYEGTNDPCYPDVSDFVNSHKGMVKMVKTSAGHGYMFDNGGSTILNTAKSIMTQKL